VISDIDDTIKETHVKLGASHIPNPAIVFDGLRPWHPVPGMARVYCKNWGPFAEQAQVNRRARRESTIIYVSAGPCRYDKRLRRVIPEWKFPTGKIVLRAGGLIPSPDYKTKAIAPIIAASPQRSFILVGDSGEHDPECYGELARRFRGQIDAIYIRNISAYKGSRYDAAFHDVPRRKIHFLPAHLAITVR
jgi:phosphatidate phosphatase APP1